MGKIRFHRYALEFVWEKMIKNKWYDKSRVEVIRFKVLLEWIENLYEMTIVLAQTIYIYYKHFERKLPTGNRDVEQKMLKELWPGEPLALTWLSVDVINFCTKSDLFFMFDSKTIAT